MTDSAIDRYLDELHARLWLPPQRIRRVIAEADDHLREATAHYEADGLTLEEAEQRAIADFGSVTAVARRFAAVEGRVFPPSLLMELFLTAVILGGVGMAAIGVSGGLAQVMGMAFGKDFISSNPPGVTYTAERCAEFQQYYTGDCGTAATAHHFDEVVQYRVAAGVLGVLALGVGLALRKQYRGRAGVRLLPPSLAPAIGAAAFGGAAVFLLLPSLMEVVFHLPGAGGLLSGGLVSLVMFCVFAVPLMRTLRVSA